MICRELTFRKNSRKKRPTSSESSTVMRTMVYRLSAASGTRVVDMLQVNCAENDRKYLNAAHDQQLCTYSYKHTQESKRKKTTGATKHLRLIPFERDHPSMATLMETQMIARMRRAMMRAKRRHDRTGQRRRCRTRATSPSMDAFEFA